MALDDELQNVTALVTPMGLYKWKRLPVGLESATEAFIGFSILVYLDEIIAFSNSLEEHLNSLDLVLGRLTENVGKLKPQNAIFFQKKKCFAGHIVANKGVEVDQQKVALVSKMKSPQTLKELIAKLAPVVFYRRFIQDSGIIAEPLYKLLKKERFSWSKECKSAAVERLKQALKRAPILVTRMTLTPVH